MHFCDVQIALRKTGDLTIDDGINHTEIVNMVSEGVRVALEDHDNNKQANNTEETKNLRIQLKEMKELIENMNNTQ